MQELPVLIKDRFFRFLNGTLPINEFELWVYTTDSLERILNSDDYLKLISLDFSRFNANSKIVDILR